MESITVGEYIKRGRSVLGLNQVEFGERAGLNPATIWALETGKQVPRPSTLRKLAEALGVEVSDIVTGNFESMISAKKGLAPAAR